MIIYDYKNVHLGIAKKTSLARKKEDSSLAKKNHIDHCSVKTTTWEDLLTNEKDP